ncbi:MAG: hypothetical protein KGJ57_06765 [Sphingomonadales bacterium]|nr:hypothetical protein [Sphingomonadales bacterium]MDE2169117.1 hypothetical protein [Sphingomonadales bacterium]
MPLSYISQNGYFFAAERDRCGKFDFAARALILKPEGRLMRELVQFLLARLWQIFSDVVMRRRFFLVAGAVVLGLAAMVVWMRVMAGGVGAVSVRLDAGMAAAGARNASDAVAAVQLRTNSEKAMEGSVSDARSAITAARNVAGADAAGRDGLCAISSGFCAASSVQQPDPR